MTFEQTIAELLEVKLAPLVAELAATRRELAEVRRALPAQLVKIPEAAIALRVSEATVRRRIADGSIPVRKVGRSVRVDLVAAQRGPSDEAVRRQLRQIPDHE